MKQKELAEALYSMELGQSIEIGTLDALMQRITRVPGGWTYSYHSGSCFIPYSDEFDPNMGDKSAKLTCDREWKIGDTLIITGNESGHGFKVGDEVELIEIDKDDNLYLCRDGNTKYWIFKSDAKLKE